ncbi:MAG: Gfo/Idh/MocA family oxidoreductase [Bacteroidetes bacterium]|nr:Gfo/Idh/MocA family oxidoreductase [Bacteroidota bacterium]
MGKVRIGVLSTAKIGRVYVIPAMQKSDNVSVTAIASRNLDRAKETAKKLGIAKAYGSYEELLASPDIDAVYIPLPNHMHVEWSIKSLEAGKHVLCEKPIGMDADDARKLKAASQKYPGLKVMEAFMYRHHPRWKRVVEIVKSDELGEIKSVHSFFSYYNNDPDNYRNSAEMGGGGLMDVGCYSISVARLIFNREPDHVTGYSEYDPEFGVDRLTSGLMSFGSGTSVFTCSTQCYKGQYVKIYGTKGMMELDWPFNPDFSKDTTLTIRVGNDERVETFGPCDHFTQQAEEFAHAILTDSPVRISLDDSIGNMEVIDRVRGSAAV